MSDTSVLQITEEVIDLTVSATDSISVDIISDNVALTVNNMAIPTQTSNATGIVFSGHTGMSSNTVDAAIKELADIKNSPNQLKSNLRGRRNTFRLAGGVLGQLAGLGMMLPKLQDDPIVQETTSYYYG